MIANKNKALVDKIQRMQDCARSSARTYASVIRRLGNLFAPKKFNEDLKWVTNPGILEKIKKFDTTLHARRNLVNGMIIALRLNPNKSLSEKYVAYLKELNKQVEDQARSGKLTAKQSAKWLSFKKIVALRKLLAKQLRLSQSYDRKTLRAKDHRLITQHLVICLYTMTSPVRLDWATVKWTTEKGFQNIARSSGNHLVIRRSGMQVYWTSFKTAKTMKEVVTDIPKPLAKVIRKYLKWQKKWFPDTNHLLLNSKYEPMSRMSLGAFLTNIFKTYYGKRISASQLRLIFLSHHFSHDEDKKRERIAREMHHSLGTQKLHYVKKPDAE